MLTPKQRDLLIGARSLIESGAQEYLCIAIKRFDTGIPSGTPMHRAILSQGCKDLCDYIAKQIRGDAGDWLQTLNSWQSMNGFDLRSRFQCRLDRLAWCDWLLDDWISHDGSGWPGVNVSAIRFRDGREFPTGRADALRWNHEPAGDAGHGVDIVAYKVAKC